MSSGKQPLILTQADRDLLSHLYRYRITTRNIARSFCYPAKRLNKVSERLSRLIDHAYLQRFELVHPEYYFTFAERGRRRVDAPRHWAQSLKPQALKSSYASLVFCCCHDHPVPRLTKQELRDRDKGLVQSVFRGRHYFAFDREDGEHLGLIRSVHRGDPAYAARKLRKDVMRHLEFPAFQSLSDKALFAVAIVTSDPKRSAAVKQAVTQSDWAHTVRVRFIYAVRPQLRILGELKL